MKSLLSAEVKNFVLDRSDWEERVNYINKCMWNYRSSQMNSNTKSEDLK